MSPWCRHAAHDFTWIPRLKLKILEEPLPGLRSWLYAYKRGAPFSCTERPWGLKKKHFGACSSSSLYSLFHSRIIVSLTSPDHQVYQQYPSRGGPSLDFSSSSVKDTHEPRHQIP